ncbi:MAG: hypothetical protein QOD07_997 [Frankiaceae bacterium]|jgi:hypothetical protein|nr:hypothetical protein [Frankiaceae bacterium]
MSRSYITLRPRDHELVRAAWSLGWVTCRVLTDVISPMTSPRTLAGRLAQLADARFLRRRRIVGGPGGHLWLYGAGPKASAIDPAYANAWRPPDFHLAHTIEVGDTIAALLTPGRLGAISVNEWKGQAELRTWHKPGAAMPDLSVRWTSGECAGAWLVEVDRGTESRHALRSKFLRYLHTPACEVLIVTTSDERARNIAILARELGAAVLTTDRRALRAADVPQVYDARSGRRRLADEIA